MVHIQVHFGGVQLCARETFLALRPHSCGCVLRESGSTGSSLVDCAALGHLSHTWLMVSSSARNLTEHFSEAWRHEVVEDGVDHWAQVEEDAGGQVDELEYTVPISCPLVNVAPHDAVDMEWRPANPKHDHQHNWKNAFKYMKHIHMFSKAVTFTKILKCKALKM